MNDLNEEYLCGNAAAVGDVETDMIQAAFQRELDTFRSKLKVPAVAGAVTDRDELLAFEVAGTRSRTDSTRVSGDDAWHIGSCTKSITALLYGCLVEAGKAEWGTSVGDLFGDIGAIDSSWSTPTVDDLLRCRAGVRANPRLQDFAKLHASPDRLTAQRTNAATEVLQSSAKNPGQFVYSNLGYTLVGAAIDRLAEMPFEDAMHSFIFEPLGVTSAGVGPPPAIRGHYPRVRLGPLLAGAGAPAEPQARKPADNPPLLNSAGRYFLSIVDWARIQRVFLNNGSPLVDTETIDHLLHDPDAPSPQDSAKKRSMAMGWTSGATLDVPYAMQGSNLMWSATALMDRESGRTALVAANDGRTSVLRASAHLGASLLKLAH